MKRWKMKKLATVVLTMVMLLETILPSFSALAAGSNEYLGGAGNKVVDLDTSTKYSESLGDNASTEYSGRVWTDKSVYSDDVTFKVFGGGETTIELNKGNNLGEDFLVAYSALATSESISGQSQAPVDVVFIIDISGSMSNQDSNMDNGYSRIYNTVQAVNTAIDEVMAINPYTRVSVVAFSSNATTLLPLDRYTRNTTIERRWVQTGFFSWQGYYEEVEVTLPFFSLSRNTASSDYAVLYTNAKNSSNNVIEKSTDVEGGTNIQMGLYEGMKILADESETTANINGQEVQRVPSVILLSDGSPTYSSNSSSWWAPNDNYNDGPGSRPYAGNAMKAILVGSYMKDAIDRNYGVAGTSYATSVYTVGMGIEELDENEKALAYMTLDTGRKWNDNSYTNTMKTTIKDYWTSYTANNNTGTLNINVGKYQDGNYSNKNYYLTHPTTGYDIDAANGYDWVEGYYSADNASAVTSVFEEIVSNISISAPQVPTEIKGTAPVTETGYITYTDPIGKYMEVKDVKAIIYAGTTFTQKEKKADGTYVFSGTVDSAVYGHQEIKDIIIQVTRDNNGDETLVIKIPASVIPIRVNSVTLNEDGTVKTHTNNGAYPARIVYSVGLKSEVVKYDNGVAYIDKKAVDDDYLAKNTNQDGTINFYSNVYKDPIEVNGSTVGNATVRFEPNHSNKFYYILEDMPIYKDKALTQQITAAEGIDDNTVYYYLDEYYHGNSVEIAAIERTGAQLKRTEIITGSDGNLYRAAGSPRLNRILKFEGRKIQNATNTAQDFYAPTFEYLAGSVNAYDGQFVVYLGNNGLLSLTAGGNLEISKKVVAGEGLTAPDKSFKFTLDLDGAEVNSGEYDYVILDKDGNEIETGIISASNTVLYLKADQKAIVHSLPPKTDYKVIEEAVEGFVSASTGAEGTIEANETDVAEFTNTYNVTPVTFPTDSTLSGQKVLKGRDWGANDKFTFFLTPYNNAPLPAGYDSVNGVTVSAPDIAGERIASFEFGRITYTAPGIYRYTIYEKEPENDDYLPGMTYSRALYRLVVTVVDNGDGTMKVSNSDVQKLYDDGANPLFTYGANNEIVMNDGQQAQDTVVFTNTYSADSVVRVPVALKDYTDNSGMKPLVSGMFEFKLEAKGYKIDNGSFVADITNVPMPAKSVTTNEGHNVTFLPVEFTHAHIPENADSITFRYEMSEIIPQNAQYGMVYDTNVYTIDVVVSTKASGTVLDVTVIYPNNEEVVTFKNTYTPDSAKVTINGNKTLIGRNMKAGENFEFKLEAADELTKNAVINGDVIIPSALLNVSGAADGVASPFKFENIEFKKAGTYLFAVSETKGTAPSVKYDDSVEYVTVVVDDKELDGKLEADVSYSEGKQAAEFVNGYSTEFYGTPVSLLGNKKLSGKTLLAGEFYFKVVEHYNDGFVSEKLVTHTEKTQPDAAGNYVGDIEILKNVTYSEAGKYTYYITEQIPETLVGGTTYDRNEYRYEVIVEDTFGGEDYVGKLTVTSKTLSQKTDTGWVALNNSDVIFENKYEPNKAVANLPLIKKVISGERAGGLKDGEFQFEIVEISSSVAGAMTLPSPSKVFNAANGDIIFGNIEFSKAGKYVVAVKEIIPADAQKIPGITYSTQIITAEYTVVDDRIGNLFATLTMLEGGDEFINEYKAEPGEVEVTIKKNFTGRANDEWKSTDEFEFEIVVLDEATRLSIENKEIEFPLDNATNDIAKKSITATTPDKAVKGNVKVNRAGTYKFIVREITGNIPGVHYDSTPYEVVITATDNSTNATIETSVTINGQPVPNATITFNNVYDKDSTEISGHQNLTVKKNFTGRVNNVWLDSDSFEFKIEANNSATQTAVDNGEIQLPANLIVTNANKAHSHFGNIIFHKEGRFEFKVTEIRGTIPKVNYSDAEKVIVVNVVDNGVGELVATLDSANSDALEFTNTYTPDSVKVGRADLTISKMLSGRNWKDGDAFKFNLKPYGQVAEQAIADGKIVILENEITINGQASDLGEIKSASFDGIEFKTTGSFVFVITEQQGTIDRVDYDKHEYFVYVAVTDDTANGKLVASVRYVGSSSFVNEYTPEPVSVEVIGTKELIGNRNLKADDFEFTITADNNTNPMPQNIRVKNTADSKNNINFGRITFIKAGVYEYTISEVVGNIKGVSYDTVDVKLTVNVTYDEATGKLSAAAAYVKGNGNKFEFINSFKSDASDALELVAKKDVTASVGNSYNLVGGEFEFIIEGSQGAPMPAQTTVSNDVNGNVSFGRVTFDKAGTFTYKISEKKGEANGFTYDLNVYTITVVVTEDIDNAKFKIAATNDSLEQDGSIIFRNHYSPKAVKVTLGANGELVKNLEGRDIKNEEFVFALLDSEGKEIATDKNDENGKFEFVVEYTAVGTYEYKIIEKNNGIGGVTYDTNSYDVKIVVTDDNGTLKANVVYSLNGQPTEKVEFKNNYSATEVGIVVNAIKVLNGKSLENGEFKFVIKDESGKTVATATNTEDGKIIFDSIIFKNAGTYKYTLGEEKGNAENVTYDETSYVIEVVITDNGEGKLVAAEPVVKKGASNDKVTEIKFVNTYSEPPAPPVESDPPAEPTPPDDTKSPHTADVFNISLWLALCFVSGGYLFGYALLKNKKEEK